MLSSSGGASGRVEFGAGAEHASAGQGDECVVVSSPFAAFALVVGAGERVALAGRAGGDVMSDGIRKSPAGTWRTYWRDPCERAACCSATTDSTSSATTAHPSS
jgi:hypothetical protein